MKKSKLRSPRHVGTTLLGAIACCTLSKVKDTNAGLYWGYSGGLYSGYIGIMEKKMETTIEYIGVLIRIMS